MKPTAIEHTVQKTNLWLHEICRSLRTEDERIAYHALRAVSHALRDRLSVEDAVAFGAQLPMLVRGLYYEGWHVHGKPLHVRKADEFLGLVAENLALDKELAIDARHAVDAVFGTLQEHMAAGAIDKLLRALPRDVQTLFAPSLAARFER